MHKKNIITLSLCAVCMIGVLAVLYALSPLSKDIYRGEFSRNFIKDSYFIREIASAELPYNSYYIAGLSSDNAYLGNWTNAFHLIEFNLSSLDSQYHYIKLKQKDTIRSFDGFMIKVDSPNLFITKGNIPRVFEGTLTELSVSSFEKNIPFFIDTKPISNSSLVIKYYSAKNQSSEIGKKIKNQKDFTFNYDILEKQIDGVFCVDGTINYSKSLNKIVYLYKYRNQYIVTDTSLSILHRSNTIDGFQKANIQTADIQSESKKMLTGIPSVVNLESSVYDKYLFVRSNILAKNEDVKSFMEGTTFDIYDILKGKYIGSFNIYNPRTTKLSSFEINHDKLVAIFGETIRFYDLNLKVLENIRN